MESLALCIFVLGYGVLAVVIVFPLAAIGATKLPAWWSRRIPRWFATHRARLLICFVLGMLLACLGLLLNPRV